MGFSVTAANVIFFIAGLTAASAFMNAFWETTETTAEAREVWSRSAADAAHTSLSLVVNFCSNPCKAPSINTVRIDVTNTGSTNIDSDVLTLVIDGRAHRSANFTDRDIVAPTTISTTSLILPGETMRIELRDVPASASYSVSTLPVWAITSDGVKGGR